MALSPCRKCQQGISNEAAFCPYCGAPCQPALSLTSLTLEQARTLPETPPPRVKSTKWLKRQRHGFLGITFVLVLLTALAAWQVYWRGHEAALQVHGALSRLEHSLLSKFLHGHQGAVFGVAFSPDGKTLASGSGDKTIILWDVGTRQPLGTPLTASAVASVAFSPDGKTLASGTWDKTVILWDVGTRQPLGLPLTGHTDAGT